MTKKRKRADASGTSDVYGSWKQSNSPRKPGGSESYVDQRSGQRGAIPLLDNSDDDSDSAEALSYLRSVR